MTHVLHYDKNSFETHSFRESLAKRLSQEKDVVYRDLSEEFEPTQDPIQEIEKLLPEQDVLLIHPGSTNQRRVLEYKKIYPSLRIAFVIPSGDGVKEYDLGEGSRFIPQSCLESVVNFVLEK